MSRQFRRGPSTGKIAALGIVAVLLYLALYAAIVAGLIAVVVVTLRLLGVIG